ncbi:MAG TPA: GxxExxY protein, partial [Opitutus sp.]|nr:GxxExxY protein [Opitutus sp.]
MNELIYPEESYAIIGACFDIYNEKGCGFLEPTYHDCMEIELGLRRIPFVHEPSLALTYKGFPLKRTCSPDFIC